MEMVSGCWLIRGPKLSTVLNNVNKDGTQYPCKDSHTVVAEVLSRWIVIKQTSVLAETICQSKCFEISALQLLLDYVCVVGGRPDAPTDRVVECVQMASSSDTMTHDKHYL